MVAATESQQEAAEFGKLKHGVFTYAMLEAFNNIKDNKTLTIRQLTAYLEQRVPELTVKYRGTEQFPLALGTGQDFPLLLKTVKASPFKARRDKSAPTLKPERPAAKQGCSKAEFLALKKMGFSVREALQQCNQ